jgi:hypothetical protein
MCCRAEADNDASDPIHSLCLHNVGYQLERFHAGHCPWAEPESGGSLRLDPGKALRGSASLRKTRGTHAELMEIWMAGYHGKREGNDASCLAAKTQPQGSRRPKGSQWQESSNCLSTRNQLSGSG